MCQWFIKKKFLFNALCIYGQFHLYSSIQGHHYSIRSFIFKKGSFSSLWLECLTYSAIFYNWTKNRLIWMGTIGHKSENVDMADLFCWGQFHRLREPIFLCFGCAGWCFYGNRHFLSTKRLRNVKLVWYLCQARRQAFC